MTGKSEDLWFRPLPEHQVEGAKFQSWTAGEQRVVVWQRGAWRPNTAGIVKDKLTARAMSQMELEPEYLKVLGPGPTVDEKKKAKR